MRKSSTISSQDSSQSSANRVLRIKRIASLYAIGEPSSIRTALASGSHSIGPPAPREVLRPRGDLRLLIMEGDGPELSSSSLGTCNSFNAIRSNDFQGFSSIRHSGVLVTILCRVAGGRLSFIPESRQDERLFSCNIFTPTGWALCRSPLEPPANKSFPNILDVEPPEA